MDIIKILTIFLIGLSSTSGDKKEKLDCNKFKTGKFFNKRDKDGVIDTKITRTKDYQIEKYYKFNAKCTFKIIWTDKCTYELIFDSGNEECRKIVDQTKKVFVEIIETTDNSYTVEGWLEGSSQKYKSELIRADK